MLQHLLSAAPIDGAWKLVVFLFTLSVLIVFHEYGHFLIARLNKVRVNDFAVGFGPTLLKWTSRRSGTNYRLNLIPLGGYCAMQGEDGKTSEAEQQREFRRAAMPDLLANERGAVALLEPPSAVSQMGRVNDPLGDNFQAKTPWQRLAIVLAGPVANFILTFVLLFVAAAVFGATTAKFGTTIGKLVAGSPAELSGLHTGDRVVAVNGKAVSDGDVLFRIIQGSPGKQLQLKVARGSSVLAIAVTPKPTLDGTKTVGRLGFSRVLDTRQLSIPQAAQASVSGFGDMFDQNVVGLFKLATNPAKNVQNVSSVVGMGRASGMIQDLGWGPYLQFAATISMALGIFNLLPFPALDGGRAAFIVAELLRGRPVDPAKEALVHVAGFAMLMVLMLAVVYKDVANMVAGKGVF